MEVRPAQIDIYLASRRAELAYATFQNETDFIRRFFTWAFESMMIGVNPTLHIKIRHIRYSAGKVLTYEEESRILTGANRYQTLKILLTLDAGLRANDARQLRWENFDMKNRWLRFQVTKEYGRALMVPLTSRLYESLSLHPREHEMLFTYCGQPIKDDFSKFVFKLRRATGIIFRHHDLRHTFYSRLKKASDHDLAEWCLGHVPAQGYAPPLPEELREAFESMEINTMAHLADFAISNLEETA